MSKITWKTSSLKSNVSFLNIWHKLRYYNNKVLDTMINKIFPALLDNNFINEFFAIPTTFLLIKHVYHHLINNMVIDIMFELCLFLNSWKHCLRKCYHQEWMALVGYLSWNMFLYALVFLTRYCCGDGSSGSYRFS